MSARTKQLTIVAAVMAALGSTSCGNVVREGRSPAFLVIDSLKGAAGTAFLFDTSTIHRQGIPMLEPRQAIFYAYHDPGVPLQQEDVEYYRYHPLLLNAALLGNLSREDERVLGFGDQRSFRSSFVRKDGLPALARLCHASMTVSLRVRMWRELTRARLARLLGS